MSSERFTVDEQAVGMRLDQFLQARMPDYSRNRLQRLIADGAVRVDGRMVRLSGRRLKQGTVVEAILPQAADEPAQDDVLPDLALPVFYLDDDLLVVDKPAGVVVHPAPGHSQGTLVSLARRYWTDPHFGDQPRPGIVHRLDKLTSGLIIIARHAAAQSALSALMARHKIDRRYLALLHGRLEPAQGSVDAPIGRDQRNRRLMSIQERGRAATTHYRVLEHISDYSYVELRLETGRTHQIRVHMQAIGHPVVADPTYGRKGDASGLQRQFLHAWRLAFRQPLSGVPIDVKSRLPQELQDFLTGLRG